MFSFIHRYILHFFALVVQITGAIAFLRQLSKIKDFLKVRIKRKQRYKALKKPETNGRYCREGRRLLCKHCLGAMKDFLPSGEKKIQGMIGYIEVNSTLRCVDSDCSYAEKTIRRDDTLPWKVLE